MRKILLASMLAFFPLLAFGAVEKVKPAATPAVKYRTPQAMSFDAQSVDGHRKTDDIDVVTGESDEIVDGLLRLRNNFNDHTALMLGEEVKP